MITRPSARTFRRLTFIGAALLFGLTLAGLDLRYRGLLWNWFWSQTGEERPLAQIRGMIEVAGNLIRQPLDTAPLAAINHKADIPYGINTFLQQEVEAEKIEAMLRMIREAGFVWLRQEFPWEDLEVTGRGQFDWAKYDRIVEMTAAHGLRLMVRLSNPPAWSRADPQAGDLAPPDDLQDFVNYAAAVAQRYQGRITHYQVWNEPNIFPEWGNNFVDPARYTELLCRAYAAQFKRVGRFVLRADLIDVLANDGGAGEGDEIHVLVACQIVSNLVPKAGHDIVGAGRKSGLGHDFCKQNSQMRRHFRWQMDHRVPDRQRVGDKPCVFDKRNVERCDDRNHSERFADRH